MKNSISKKIMKNYIYMFVLAFALAAFVFILLLNLGRSASTYSNEENYAQMFIKNDYKNIDLNMIKEHNGTAFIVDKNLNVISLCGDNIPCKKRFTMSEWTEFINTIDSNNKNYQCNIAYNDKNKFWFVVELPVAFQCVIDFNINTSKEILPEAVFIVFVMLCICFLVIFIYVYIYSKLTSKYFVKPLKMFSNMVVNLEKGNYKERLHINKDDEFGMLSESFNNLADSLENEKKLRKESEDNRKRLILDISHDLKNPLTSTMGSLELCLKENDMSTKQRHYLKMAYNNSIRAKNLINELFEYSKLDSPDYKLKLQKTDICEYMRMQIASELEIIEEAGFKGEYDIPAESINVEIDQVNFGRVIHNLISNTIKYNNEGTQLYIAVTEDEENAQIIIKDNGIGMSREKSLKIFDVFVRGDKQSEANGTGIGLAVAKKVVTMHNGTIDLETDTNMGCTFRIKIPKI